MSCYGPQAFYYPLQLFAEDVPPSAFFPPYIPPPQKPNPLGAHGLNCRYALPSVVLHGHAGRLLVRQRRTSASRDVAKPFLGWLNHMLSLTNVLQMSRSYASSEQTFLPGYAKSVCYYFRVTQPGARGPGLLFLRDNSEAGSAYPKRHKGPGKCTNIQVDPWERRGDDTD
ncbi:hypothetical protein EDB87DRAFT_1580939 [Lactarius vividus]|nr:hypothetical protein EDB87DRAFT_1580939 [Lactarius vividus]